MTFLYKSKYQRHIESAAHRRRVLVLSFDDQQIDKTEDSPFHQSDDSNESQLDSISHLEEPNTSAVEWTLLI